jgi:hypothetical protein
MRPLIRCHRQATISRSPLPFRVFLCGIVLCSSLLAQDSNYIRISYSPVKQAFSLHEPILVKVSIENTSSSPVSVDLGANYYGGFHGEAVTPSGEAVAIGSSVPAGLSASGVIAVPPAGTYSRLLLLNRWLEFTTPGTYSVRLELKGRTGSQEEPKQVESTAGGFAIDVLPPDPVRLDAVCADLEGQAVGSASFDAELQAAEALSYVEDPIAVPHLEHLLRADGRIASVVINGLERIGGSAALDALNANASHPSAEVRLLVRAALERMANGERRKAPPSRVD